MKKYTSIFKWTPLALAIVLVTAVPVTIDAASETIQRFLGILSAQSSVTGTLTHNNAAPSSNNIGALTGLANAAAPTFTEGDLVLASTDLHGSTRVTNLDSGGTSVTDSTAHAIKMEPVDNTGAFITPSTLGTQNTALTIASTTGGQAMYRASAAAPTDVGADDRSVMPWALRSGAQVIQPSYGGTLASTAASGVPKVGVTGNAGAAFDAATGAAPPANALYVGGLASGATGGFMAGYAACDSDVVINLASTTATKLISGVSGRKVHICSIDIGPIGGANNVALIEGTKTTNECDTSAAGLFGGTTTGSGWNIAANSGVAYGGGIGDIAASGATGKDICIVASANTQVSGHIKYAIY